MRLGWEPDDWTHRSLLEGSGSESPPGSFILKQVTFQSPRHFSQGSQGPRLLARRCTSVCQAKETQGDGGSGGGGGHSKAELGVLRHAGLEDKPTS